MPASAPSTTPFLTWELIECLDILYKILDDLEGMRVALDDGWNPEFFLFPSFGFDPFKTMGKY